MDNSSYIHVAEAAQNKPQCWLKSNGAVEVDATANMSPGHGFYTKYINRQKPK